MRVFRFLAADLIVVLAAALLVSAGQKSKDRDDFPVMDGATRSACSANGPSSVMVMKGKAIDYEEFSYSSTATVEYKDGKTWKKELTVRIGRSMGREATARDYRKVREQAERDCDSWMRVVEEQAKRSK